MNLYKVTQITRCSAGERRPSHTYIAAETGIAAMRAWDAYATTYAETEGEHEESVAFVSMVIVDPGFGTVLIGEAHTADTVPIPSVLSEDVYPRSVHVADGKAFTDE